jgi:hypothetical protein
VKGETSQDAKILFAAAHSLITWDLCLTAPAIHHSSLLACLGL